MERITRSFGHYISASELRDMQECPTETGVDISPRYLKFSCEIHTKDTSFVHSTGYKEMIKPSTPLSSI